MKFKKINYLEFEESRVYDFLKMNHYFDFTNNGFEDQNGNKVDFDKNELNNLIENIKDCIIEERMIDEFRALEFIRDNFLRDTNYPTIQIKVSEEDEKYF